MDRVLILGVGVTKIHALLNPTRFGVRGLAAIWEKWGPLSPARLANVTIPRRHSTDILDAEDCYYH